LLATIFGFVTGGAIFCMYAGYNYYNLVAGQYHVWDYEYKAVGKSCIYAADGSLISEIYDYNRVFVPLADISPALQQAVIAIEDRRFYEHFGVDMQGVLRAFWVNCRSGEMLQGGSTITQQLVRNLFLSGEKTVVRKIKEMMLAVALEKSFNKDRILEMYLNEVYFGNGCYGVEAAAQKYFSKHAAELGAGEASMLAAIPRSPGYYDPYVHPEALLDRRNDVLDQMEIMGFISHEEKIKTRVERAVFSKLREDLQYYKFPYYTTQVIQQLTSRFGKEKLYQGGLKVYTTLRPAVQTQAEQAALQSVERFKAGGINATSMSIVSILPESGAVAALVGGVDFKKDQNNMAVIPRQPGSAIKPLHYAAAMQKGLINPRSLLSAGTKSFGNYLVKSHMVGRITVSDALKFSVNVAAVDLMNMLGTTAAMENLKQLGISTLVEGDANLSLALGGMTYGIGLLELTAAYVPFAAGGIYYEPYLVERVEDMSGRVLFIHNAGGRRVFSASVAGEMNAMLTRVVTGGTGAGARIPGGAAGKTGTTDNSRCVWFVGYNKDIVTGLWAGNTDNSPIGSYSGGDLVAPVWREYMSGLMESGLIEGGLTV
jgi:penicillin-binding protein 1A